MNIKSIVLAGLVAGSFSGTIQAIPDNMLSVYTAATGIIGGGVTAGIASSDMGAPKSVGVGLLVGAACSAIGYWILKDKTATARYTQANRMLCHVKNDPSFAQVPANDGNQSYTRPQIAKLEAMVDDAASLLQKAKRDVQDDDVLFGTVITRKGDADACKTKIKHMYAHLIYNQVSKYLRIIEADQLMQTNENYVRHAQWTCTMYPYPLLHAFDVLVKYDEGLGNSKYALSDASSAALNESRLQAMIVEQQEKLTNLKYVAQCGMYALKQYSGYMHQYQVCEQLKLQQAQVAAEQDKAYAARLAAQAEQQKARAAQDLANAQLAALFKGPDVVVIHN